ncbi:MAPEG family protein [Novosphingobium decolorationis]|uniref:MAPEG family protein n=1 Tax=Novosphingobium decolorationis TaxID=2698673 RepID=A0ABX8E1N5_9SPHN|nr:MAPEG family protein [Novosphingobium decolorationis]QVM82828.1 MAPEG family protein [Novosphingobium decolorationis]
MILPTTLCLAATAVLINLWLGARIGKMRGQEKILHGDGDNPRLMQRMRAQANFIENAPFLLILAGAIEISGKGGIWLPLAGALFMVARVCHGLGMDRSDINALRAGGFGIGLLVTLGLAVVAVLIALRLF